MNNVSAGTSNALTLRPYRLLCGIPTLAQELASGLRQVGWETQENAEVTLLIDGPWGIALQGLQKNDASEVVIVTDNPCPEYWEDLWEYRPRALLAGGHSMTAIAEGLRRATSGESFYHTPQHESLLTNNERRLLQCNAISWENKRIANELGLSEGTIKNRFNSIFQKLGLTNRTQLALYYLGAWHMLQSHQM